ncbi:MAG: SpoIIE family protein phosphatase [Thermoanaerobaculia bacterium]|nr:SpoIIE family protein phosphatase [Thermoanaerobaculia bacterium]
MSLRPHITTLLLIFGLLAFGIAGLSIADMFVPRPYDGVVLRQAATSEIVVSEVLPDSSAERAGVLPGDEIRGIGRQALAHPRDAAEVLEDYRIGQRVPYLIKRPGEKVFEIEVELSRRSLGDGTYFYISFLGFAFFFIGFFVLVRQPGLVASQVFFFMACLFLLLLVCRLRPLSYSGIDTAILSVGTGALLFLPSAFLHFFLIFPRPVWLRAMASEGRWRPLTWLFLGGGWPLVYILPPLVLATARLFARKTEGSWLTDAPLTSWWLLATFVGLGFAGLVANARRIQSSRERRGMVLVLLGSVFGLTPFALASVVLPNQASTMFFVLGVVPLVLVPITFTYAIVRFQLLDIRVILRRSLLYTVTTALVTSLYAGGIAMFNAFFRDSALARGGYFPIVLALAIVVLFDPVRRRVQNLIDRSFFAERSRLQDALKELTEAMTAQSDLQAVVRDLAERLPQILDIRFCGLYMVRHGQLERLAGPAELPPRLAALPELQRFLARRRGLHRLDQLGSLPLRSPKVAQLVETLVDAGVESLADLASRRRQIGLALFSPRQGQAPLEPEEQELLERLLDQASIALETGLLLEERTQQAELEREMEIAASIQARLLPDRLQVAPGWQVAAQCRPARIVGGDFFTQLPAMGHDGGGAVVYGDVAGKSVSGALMMMAAHEALHTLSMAMDGSDPARLFDLANRRVYQLGKRNFVAMAYLSVGDEQGLLRYMVAGQPPPLLRRASGTVEELPMVGHRLPVGAFRHGGYQVSEVRLEPGDIVLGYSDGVTEARSSDGDFFGEDRLLDVVATAVHADPEELVREVSLAVEAFSDSNTLYDDVTLVAVARTASSMSSARDPDAADRAHRATGSDLGRNTSASRSSKQESRSTGSTGSAGRIE